jgi:c-di-GMP-binding flagellar brake protein YcgR
VREKNELSRIQGAKLIRKRPEIERRRWSRLPLAIPVFVRSKDEKGKEFLEFATALNISAGGALIAVRRALPLATQVLLEIPSAPLVAATSLPKASRTLRARTLRVAHAEGYHLVGLKFSHPLLNESPSESPSRRKVDSPL